VHTYGSPCDLDRMEALARDHDLRLLYDGAHTFGVRHEGRALSSWGEATTLSFHATKLYSTVEGGALVCSSRELKEEADRLANFCILDEERVAGTGINGKLNEVLCAYGLAALEDVGVEIQRRRRVAAVYREGLREVPGLYWLPESDTTSANGAYFPVLVDPQEFGVDRDELHLLLRRCNVVTRKYFHPLLSHCRPYCDLPSAEPGQLPVAERVAERVLCLPIHGSLDPHVPTRITELLRQVSALAIGG
jgi:dTDP-4-amino-4,6-dideoxygalactose transaminase